MRRFLLSRTFRAYVLAVLSVLLAVSLRTVASPGPEHRAGLLLLAAVTITTWYGGLWPGLVALVFAASCDAWILPPPNSFSIASRDDVERLVGFILMAGLVTA